MVPAINMVAWEYQSSDKLVCCSRMTQVCYFFKIDIMYIDISKLSDSINHSHLIKLRKWYSSVDLGLATSWCGGEKFILTIISSLDTPNVRTCLITSSFFSFLLNYEGICVVRVLVLSFIFVNVLQTSSFASLRCPIHGDIFLGQFPVWLLLESCILQPWLKVAFI